MNQLGQFPQISSRGRYDLSTGMWLYKKTKYTLYPKKKFDAIHKASEIVIFVHGMQNTRWGAKRGGLTLRQTLRRLGYKKHPIVTFSYDADVKDVETNYNKAVITAYNIAVQNGVIILSRYIMDLKKDNPKIKIHLVGHSMGCVLINSCIKILSITPNLRVNSIHLLASPTDLKKVKEIIPFTKVVNYYNPTDDVILKVADNGYTLPTCLVKKIKGVKTVTLLAKDHRFRSYAKELKRFP